MATQQVGRAPRNRSVFLDGPERERLLESTIGLSSPIAIEQLADTTIHQDLFQVIPHLPDQFVDLLIVDPPYNLSKKFGDTKFKQTSEADYEAWFYSWFSQIVRCLKPTASIYVCCDWQTTHVVRNVLRQFLTVRNRITWEREKGRGAKSNWKNCSEDIWFCTVSDEYHFDADAVMVKRRVIAPYRGIDGLPKDWHEENGNKYRLTSPSNLWTDISVPFWSMRENTAHPTQKSEKLVAKLILASSRAGDFVFDPFLGSGTTSVVSRKLGRHYVGVERESEYCAYAIKRLESAAHDPSIQGLQGGHFWERNSKPNQGDLW